MIRKHGTLEYASISIFIVVKKSLASGDEYSWFIKFTLCIKNVFQNI